MRRVRNNVRILRNGVTICRIQINRSRILQKFKTRGSVLDQRRNNQGRPRIAQSPENVKEIEDVIRDTPQRSVKRLLSDIMNGDCSFASMYRSLRFDLQLTPYTIPMLQYL